MQHSCKNYIVELLLYFYGLQRVKVFACDLNQVTTKYSLLLAWNLTQSVAKNWFLIPVRQVQRLLGWGPTTLYPRSHLTPPLCRPRQGRQWQHKQWGHFWQCSWGITGQNCANGFRQQWRARRRQWEWWGKGTPFGCVQSCGSGLGSQCAE